MTGFNKIEAEFIEKGLAIMQSGDRWFILSKKNSIDFIEACRRQSVQILGVDGFVISAAGKQSSLDDIIDFSSKSYKGPLNYYDASIEFINDRPDDMYFEIVCGE